MTTDFSSAIDNTKSSIRALLVSQQKRQDEFSKSSREHTYLVAAHIVILGRTLLADEDAFVELLSSRDIKHQPSANQWTHVVELVFTDKDRLKSWKNRAPALRAAAKWLTTSTDAQTLADDIGDFALDRFIKDHKSELDSDLIKAIGTSEAGRLDGLAKLDRLEHRDPNAATDADLIEEAKEATPLDLKVKRATSAEFLMLWARVEDGLIVPMGVVDMSESQAKKAAIAAGRKAAEKAKPTLQAA